MAENKKFDARIQLKHDTKENWDKAVNFIPKAGEIIIYEADATNPQRIKIGDGVTTVINLSYYDDFITPEEVDIICNGSISYAEDVRF